MLRVLLFCFVLLTPFAAFGQDAPSKDEVHKKVAAKVLAYGKSIGCLHNPNIKIVDLVPFDGQNRYEARYIVLWNGDIQCHGGSGAEFTRVALVRIGIANRFYVDAKNSSPNVEFESAANHVDKVVTHTKNTISLEGMVGDEDDAACCPSVRIRYKLKMDDKGNWKLVSKKKVTTKTDSK